MISQRHWITNGKHVCPVSMDTWARWFQTANRRLHFDKFGDVEVITSFLGLDHNFSGNGPPLIVETMIFGGEHDQYQTRCTTLAQAEAQHEEACRVARS